jgi:SET domain-containing protein
MNGSSYLSDGLVEAAVEGKGRGTVAAKPFPKGATLAAFGGDVVTLLQLHERTLDAQQNCVQIAEDLYLVPNPVGLGDRINHSCDPNAGILGQILLVALRDIEAGEEICFDYAMTDSSVYDEFTCNCGSPSCRKQITGRDWLRKDLAEKYAGYFSSYMDKYRQ